MAIKKEVEDFEQDENDIVVDKSIASKHVLRSELAQEIVSRQPGFLEKWSLLVFMGILVLMFGGTWFVRYPDIITARAIILAENGPAAINVRQEGLISKILVKNGQQVTRHTVIGWVETDVDPTEIQRLGEQIEKSVKLLADDMPENIPKTISSNFNNLGEMQQFYQQFLLAEETAEKYGFVKLKLNGQHSLVPHQRILFQQQLQFLRSRVNEWMKRNVILSPVDGKVTLNTYVREGKYVKAGAILGYVIPANPKYYAETVLPQNNFGKIDTGLQVQLRLDAYPYEEWGFLEGKISYLSTVPTEAGFLVTVNLENGLMTNDKKPVAIKSGLRAQAMIITKDMRLLQRFYYGFVKSTSVNK